tara:strand:+ start:305 stop:580 length:276 start_codon:yes stop_codon:yes gene_type:complete
MGHTQRKFIIKVVQGDSIVLIGINKETGISKYPGFSEAMVTVRLPLTLIINKVVKPIHDSKGLKDGCACFPTYGFNSPEKPNIIFKERYHI